MITIIFSDGCVMVFGNMSKFDVLKLFKCAKEVSRNEYFVNHPKSECKCCESGR